MTLLQRAKDSAVRAGLDPWLRPIANIILRRRPDEDDRCASAIISSLKRDAVFVDIGCNKGKILDLMRRAAPDGVFFAFEPVPYLFELLSAKYRSDRRVRLFNIALSSKNGSAPFFVNQQNSGLSGLSNRPGRIAQDQLKAIDVLVGTLDGALDNRHIDLIKIDVEGAEFDVLLGARETISRSRPVILFEFGLGGAEYFGVDAETMYDFFKTLDYELYSVSDYAQGKPCLSLSSFKSCFDTNSKYNFIGKGATQTRTRVA
jgi:FkbM family methyltransferase